MNLPVNGFVICIGPLWLTGLRSINQANVVILANRQGFIDKILLELLQIVTMPQRDKASISLRAMVCCLPIGPTEGSIGN